MARYGKIEQELRNRRKIARALTRLKHSIAADNELNEKLDAAEKRFFKKVQQGRLPAAVNLDALDKVFDV
jgi:hypothetical protein